ncbi:MAG: dihydrodipicolinate synthase family protein [Rhodospirillales bacterium]|nr:dihydrodipicolinate synthase family protein [Rhodospirillales bacterium]
MTRIERLGINGIYPATVCPLNRDQEIDEQALVTHISGLDPISGIKGFLINGHAGENFLLTREEKRLVTRISRQSVSDDTILVCGVNSESSAEAVRYAEDAAAAGADALLIFPPNSWAISASLEMIVAHHEAIINAVDLPVVLYQAPVSLGPMAYSHEVISALISLPRVIAIKEGSWEVATYEGNRRLVKSLNPSVAVMASGDEHLMSSFIFGSEGSMVSLAIIIPEVIIALDAAIRIGDLTAARNAHNTIYPLAKAIYGVAPANLATARLKTCLKLLGRLDCDAMRLPFRPLSDLEVARLTQALIDSGLLTDGTTQSLSA